MWRQISNRLVDYPGRLKVARVLVELGLSVRDGGSIFCGEIELSDVKIARSLGVDRRTVRDTARFIFSDETLRPIFEGLRPSGPSLARVAKYLGYTVIEIYADPHKVGVLAEASALIAHENITIRQALADDPDLTPEPKLTLVTEQQPPGQVLQKMLKIPGVLKVTAY